MDFRSDNTAPVSQEIMDAILAVNKGHQSSYGADDYSNLVRQKVAQLFEHDVDIYFVATGTAANALALSSMIHNCGIIYCHKQAHINTDESGAPSLFSACILHPVDGPKAKIDPQHIEHHINHIKELRPHANKPSGISISQSTEYGTVYSLEELASIKNLARSHNVYLHMDGARFANALVALGCSPAQMTWKSGVDVLSFGATKNGAMLAEMIIFFNKDLAKDFDFMIKRSGQLMSKERFIAAQFLAYFDHDLWIDNARHANSMAALLAECFKSCRISLLYPVVSNELFVEMTPALAAQLEAKGASFYHWHDTVYRFVTSFVTTSAEIEAFRELLEEVVIE